MIATAIAHRRLVQQRLSHAPLATPAEVVAWMGAIQAQEYHGAKWTLSLRTLQPADETIEQAITTGTILRTHVMRPTWHFVTPADIRWLLELTAPRVKAKIKFRHGQLELDDDLLARSNTVIAAALEGGRSLLRSELGTALLQAGIPTDGQRLAHMLMHAELDAVICSGPRQGKQVTYTLLDERVPMTRALDHDEALAELTRRYYTSHGPATIQDFTWWSGLTVADAKKGLALVGSHLINEVIAGQSYWFSADAHLDEPSQEAFLLPTFDEFMVGYAGFDALRRGGRDSGMHLVYESTIVLDGQVIGTWKRTLKRNAVVIEIAPFAPLSPPQQEAIRVAAQRYGVFVGLPVVF